MGSPLRATIVTPRRAGARAAWAAVVADIEATEAALSRFRADSDLSRLNAVAGDGAWRPVSRRLYAALAVSRRAWRVTGGRFDPRVIRRLEALGEEAGVPLARAVPQGTDEWLERDPRRRAVRPWSPLDSGGIGKGLALRWAIVAARAVVGDLHGLVVESGGDIGVIGIPPDGAEWRIGIDDPHAPGQPLAVVGVTGGAVVTSSTAVRSWTDATGSTVHHLIDPASGLPGGGGLVCVTVAGPDPAWAEVWSKALFLAGPRGIGPEARSRGMAAWWVGPEGRLEMTPGARLITRWERDTTA